jgi:hypothetical protein
LGHLIVVLRRDGDQPVGELGLDALDRVADRVDERGQRGPGGIGILGEQVSPCGGGGHKV